MRKSRKSRVLIVIGLILAAAAFYMGVAELKDWIKHVYAASQPRPTPFPSSVQPDQVCLTWDGDPSTSQAIQWRTSPQIEDGYVQYRPKAAGGANADVAEVAAKAIIIEDPLVENDPKNRRFAATLQGLQPATAYVYRVGSKKAQAWSQWFDFTTAPAGPAPLSFVYLGDSQGAWEKWQPAVTAAAETSPHAVFYTIVGDLVDNGYYRNMWDGFFHAGESVFSHAPLMPVPGNHDYSRHETPQMYLDLFTLPANGPDTIPPECAYSFKYGNAFFVALDGNQDPLKEVPWLDQQLSTNNAVWKIALYHQPSYSTSPHRDNKEIRQQWGAVFDKYHVDLALEGHDHSYLRTYPMKAEKRTDSYKDGTVYIISVSGPKHYKPVHVDCAEVEKNDMSTYQVIDIGVNPDRLTYRAYDVSTRNVIDEFVIEK